MFLRKRADAFKDKHEHLEVGDRGRESIKKERECERKVYMVLGLLFVITCAFLLYIRHVWNAGTADIFQRMETMIARDNLLCVSSHHVNATDRNWILLRDGTRGVNVRVIEHGKEQVVSNEVFTHCRPPFQKSVRRSKNIEVAYESESFFHVVYTKFHLASWSDESALCAQHMLDIFEGRAKCPFKPK